MALIQFNEEEKKILDASKEVIKTAHTAFETATKMVENAKDRLWERIHELFPQSDGYRDLQILWKDDMLLMMDQKEEKRIKIEQAGARDCSDKALATPDP